MTNLYLELPERQDIYFFGGILGSDIPLLLDLYFMNQHGLILS